MSELMRECPNCHVEKPHSDYQQYKGRPKGWCRKCKAEKEAARRLARGIKPKKLSVIVEGQKLCMKCDTMKPLAEFSPAKRGLGGVAAYCKPCFAMMARQSDKEAMRRRTADYRKRHRARYLANHRIAMYKYRTLKSVTSDGTVTDEFLNGLYAEPECYYCCKPTPEKERTADHVVPLNKGGIHSASNLVMACFSCNSSKRDEDAELFFERILSELK